MLKSIGNLRFQHLLEEVWSFHLSTEHICKRKHVAGTQGRGKTEEMGCLLPPASALLHSKLLQQSWKENKYRSQVFYSPSLQGVTYCSSTNCWNKNNHEANYSLAIHPRGYCQASGAQEKEKASFPNICQLTFLLPLKPLKVGDRQKLLWPSKAAYLPAPTARICWELSTSNITCKHHDRGFCLLNCTRSPDVVYCNTASLRWLEIDFAGWAFLVLFCFAYICHNT